MKFCIILTLILAIIVLVLGDCNYQSSARFSKRGCCLSAERLGIDTDVVEDAHVRIRTERKDGLRMRKPFRWVQTKNVKSMQGQWRTKLSSSRPFPRERGRATRGGWFSQDAPRSDVDLRKTSQYVDGRLSPVVEVQSTKSDDEGHEKSSDITKLRRRPGRRQPSSSWESVEMQEDPSPSRKSQI